MAIFGFGEKNKTTQDSVTSPVKVLGSGCANCTLLEENTRKALESLGMDTSIEHVTDFVAIAGFGVMTTRALVIDGQVLSSGKVLSKDEIAAHLKEARGV